MCQVNNERERNILREEEDQIGENQFGGGGGEKKMRKKSKRKERKRKEKEKKKTVCGREKGKWREGKRRFSRCPMVGA